MANAMKAIDKTIYDYLIAEYKDIKTYWDASPVFRSVIDKLKEMYTFNGPLTYDLEIHNKWSGFIIYRGYQIGRITAKRRIVEKGSRYVNQSYAYKDFEVEFWLRDQEDFQGLIHRIDGDCEAAERRRQSELRYMKDLIEQIKKDRGLQEKYAVEAFIKRLYSAKHSLIYCD